jgi:hypothetical protein
MTEIQELEVYYRGKLLQHKRDYTIVDNQIVFHVPVQTNQVQTRWIVINEK